MRSWRAVIGILVASVLMVWAYISLDRWQRQLIFHGNSYMAETPQDRGLGYSDRWIDVENGKIHGWWIPATSPRAPAALFFHGNAGTISSQIEQLVLLHNAGFAVLAVDYRGYGSSTAIQPSEASVYADAQAAWPRFLQLTPDASMRMIYGHSLGGAVAIDLATRVTGVDALVAEGTFTSIVAEATNIFPTWWPVSWLVTQRFASDDKVEGLHMPKLFIHCVDDEVIPGSMSEELYRLSPQPKAQLVIPGGNHNNCPAFRGVGLDQRHAPDRETGPII